MTLVTICPRRRTIVLCVRYRACESRRRTGDATHRMCADGDRWRSWRRRTRKRGAHSFPRRGAVTASVPFRRLYLASPYDRRTRLAATYKVYVDSDKNVGIRICNRTHQRKKKTDNRALRLGTLALHCDKKVYTGGPWGHTPAPTARRGKIEAPKLNSNVECDGVAQCAQRIKWCW